MVGHARYSRVLSHSGHVAVGSLALVDARVPSPAPDAVDKLAAKAGPAWTELHRQARESMSPLRAELSQLAGGGEPPPSSAAIAELATSTLASWRYVLMLAGELSGRREKSQEELSRDLKHLLDVTRQAAGLAVVARDLILSSRDVAKDGGSLRTVTGAGVDDDGAGILTTLGIPPEEEPEPNSHPASIDTPGGMSLGSPQEPSSEVSP